MVRSLNLASMEPSLMFLKLTLPLCMPEVSSLLTSEKAPSDMSISVKLIWMPLVVSFSASPLRIFMYCVRFVTPEVSVIILKSGSSSLALPNLKSFSDDFYRKRCGARLEPVLASLREMKRRGVWVEVTTLLIPGLNDGDGELKEIASFLVSLGPETPWHISRFHPQYRLTAASPTPLETIHRATGIGKAAG